MQTFLARYQSNLETSMRGCYFIFDSVQLLHYKSYRINFRRGESYIDYSDWMKSKKITINWKSKHDKCVQRLCFKCVQCVQYVIIVALGYGEIEWHPEKVSNIKPFITKYDWKWINYLS